MAHQDANFTEVGNVGMIEIVIRGSVAMATILAILLVPSISSSTLINLTLVTIYAGLTAFTSWDPFYALLKKARHQAPAPTPEAAVAQSSRRASEQTAGEGHKKAA